MIALWLVLALSLQTSLAKSWGSDVGEPGDELILVHSLFRHGDRAPADNLYDSNPYGNESFYAPYGYGQLTNEGKRTEFKMGQAFRERYDAFLGSEFHMNLIEARTTNVNRTKMSVLLLFAGLYPPSEKLVWNENLYWLPIPYNYLEKDKELKSRKVCTNYKKAYKKLVKSTEVQKELKQYSEVFTYLKEHTGNDIVITKPKSVANLYSELMVQQAYGYPIEDWVNKYLPEMKQINVNNYYFMTNTTKLRKLASGYLLRKLIADTKAKIENPEAPIKMYLYSAHDSNIATFLASLDIFDGASDVPAFGSYILIEVWKRADVYGFKFYYQNYNEVEPVLKTIPGCEEFCPIDEFKRLVSEYIAEDSYCEYE